MDLAALRDEIVGDPKPIGYAPMLNGRNGPFQHDWEIAELLNTPGREMVGRGTISRDDAVTLLFPILSNVVGGLVSADAATQAKAAKWRELYNLALVPKASLNMQSVTVAGLLAAIKADGFASDEEITAATMQPGSRAELLFGLGAVVTADHVADALGGLR